MQAERDMYVYENDPFQHFKENEKLRQNESLTDAPI